MGSPWPPRGPDDLDEIQRARIRREVLARVRPRRPGLADHTYAVFTVLAAPAPHIVRVLVSLALVGAVVASATVASADALPDEPLYGVKLASEQVRLAVARTPEDRATVRLSMAEHRLAEAERLAVAGREVDALVATSAYGTQLAHAAAELAAIERLEANGPTVVGRLKKRLAEQQQRAADIAARLAADPANAVSAPAFESVASAPPADATGTLSEQIAQHAASVTDQVAAVAEQRAQEQAAAEEQTAPAPAAPAQAPSEPAAAAPAPRAPAPERQVPAARVAQVPAPVRTATPQGIGSVAVPDATPARAASEERAEADRREAARKDAEKKDAERKKKEEAARKQAPAAEGSRDLNAQLSELRKKFLHALDQIKEEQKQARAAAEKAKERGKKTPSPAPKKKDR